MGTEEIKKDLDVNKWFSQLTYDQWMAIPASGARPSARYKVTVVVEFNSNSGISVGYASYFCKAVGIACFVISVGH